MNWLPLYLHHASEFYPSLYLRDQEFENPLEQNWGVGRFQNKTLWRFLEIRSHQFQTKNGTHIHIFFTQGVITNMHRIHGTCIFTYICTLKKSTIHYHSLRGYIYTSPMDPSWDTSQWKMHNLGFSLTKLGSHLGFSDQFPLDVSQLRLSTGSTEFRPGFEQTNL